LKRAAIFGVAFAFVPLFASAQGGGTQIDTVVVEVDVGQSASRTTLVRDGDRWTVKDCKAKCDPPSDMPQRFDFATIAAALGLPASPARAGGEVAFTPRGGAAELQDLTPPLAGRFTSGAGAEGELSVWNSQPQSVMPGVTLTRAAKSWYFKNEGADLGVLLVRFDQCAKGHIFLYGDYDVCVVTRYEFPQAAARRNDRPGVSP
jgi:hypothetical protein